MWTEIDEAAYEAEARIARHKARYEAAADLEHKEYYAHSVRALEHQHWMLMQVLEGQGQ